MYARYNESKEKPMAVVNIKALLFSVSFKSDAGVSIKQCKSICSKNKRNRHHEDFLNIENMLIDGLSCNVYTCRHAACAVRGPETGSSAPS